MCNRHFLPDFWLQFLDSVVAANNVNDDIPDGFHVLDNDVHMGLPSLLLPFYEHSILDIMEEGTPLQLISLVRTIRLIAFFL